MNTGPTGFAHAPVTKGLLLASLGSSIFHQAARASHRRMPGGLQSLTHTLVFTAPGELLLGSLLLYYFRVFERQSGSAKYGAYAFLVTGLSYTLQVAALHVFKLEQPPASGPYALIFASFVPFLLHIPAASKFTVLGWRMSDKAFVYMAGLQLLLSHGRASLLAGVCGLAAGLLYSLDVLRMKRFRLPRVLTRFLGRTVGSWLQDDRQPSQAVVGAAAPARPTTTGRTLHALQQPAAASPPSAEAVQQLVNMGFEQRQAEQALQQCNNDVHAAIALLV